MIGIGGTDTLTGGVGHDIFVLVGSGHAITDYHPDEDRIVELGARDFAAERDTWIEPDSFLF